MADQNTDKNKEQTIKVNNNDDLVRRLFNAIDTKNKNDTKNIKASKSFFGQVVSISDDHNFADVILKYGSSNTTLNNISNKSGLVLNIGDGVILTAPNNDLSSIYIDKSKTDTPTFDGAKIVGVISIGGINNENGTLLIKGLTDDEWGIVMHDHSIEIYDWVQDHYMIGMITAGRDTDNDGNPTGKPAINIVAEQGCSVKLGLRNAGNDGSWADGLVVNNKAYNDIQDITSHLRFNALNELYCEGYFGANIDLHHGIYIQSDDNGSNKIFGNTNCEGYDWSGIGTANMTNLQVSGSKNGVQKTEHFGSRLFYAYEGSEYWYFEKMRFNTEIGSNICYFDPIIVESINTNIHYDIIFISDDTSCVFEIIDRQPDYCVFNANKNVECTIKIEGKKIGFENSRLEYANSLSNELDINKDDRTINLMLTNEIEQIDNNINQLLNDIENNINNTVNDLLNIIQNNNN